MQWFIGLFTSSSAQLIVAWILGVMAALIARRLHPVSPSVATTHTAHQEPKLSAVNMDPDIDRRFAVEQMFELYAECRAELADIPNEFWETVRDDQHPDLQCAMPNEAEHLPHLGLWYVTQAFVVDQFKYTPYVMGRLVNDKAAQNAVRRFIERVRWYKESR